MEEEKTPIEHIISNLEEQIKELSDYLKLIKKIKEKPRLLINDIKDQLGHTTYLNYAEAKVEFDMDYQDEIPGGICLIIDISIPLWDPKKVNHKIDKEFQIEDIEDTKFISVIDDYEFAFDVTEIYENKLLITGY